MPIVNMPVVLSEASLTLIRAKTSEPNYSHTSWSDADLEPVRCEIRNHYRDVQRLTCVYCQGAIAQRSAFGAPVEHIVPKSQQLGFMFEPKNLCVICPDCNEYKGKREVLVEPVLVANRVNYPADPAAFRIMHPHYDDYDENIMRANRVYIECSDKGGYTIYICNLNRFFRKFGRCDEFVNDVELVQKSERFYGEGRIEI